MITKPPVFHPYTTNTGQVLTDRFLGRPHSMSWWTIKGSGGQPTVPFRITESFDNPILHVFTEVALIATFSPTAMPVIGTEGTIILDQIILMAGSEVLLHWPTQYFTFLPLDVPNQDHYVLVNVLEPQNAAGDNYKLDNR